MDFRWDPRKAKSNLIKHGISFEEAIRTFDDSFALIAPDPGHSGKEERFWLIGETEAKQVMVTVFTKRNKGSVTRIISARPASRRERRIYEAFKGIPI